MRYTSPNWNLLVILGKVDFQYCFSSVTESNWGCHQCGEALSKRRGQHEVVDEAVEDEDAW